LTSLLKSENWSSSKGSGVVVYERYVSSVEISDDDDVRPST